MRLLYTKNVVLTPHVGVLLTLVPEMPAWG
jgi:hypothetical protein